MPESPPPQGADEAALRREIARLNKMVQALMNRAERAMSDEASEFGQFQTTVMLEREVRQRTRDLEAALRENDKITGDLLRAKAQLEQEKEEQHKLIRRLEETDNQLLQSEKLASIGQLAAGVAHEINNPISFVSANFGTLKNYIHDLLGLVDAYQAQLQSEEDCPARTRLEALAREIDLDFLREDVQNLIRESLEGVTRVRQIVQDLKDFSRVGDLTWETVDIHAGLNSTVNLVWNEIKYKADLIKDYGNLPRIPCIPSQINQVFINLLVNAAQAIPQHGTITLQSGEQGDWIWIAVSDTGQGIPPENLGRIFDPFFTTKPVGKGTGLGLSVSYGIARKHGGRIEVKSEVGKGSTFTLWLPKERPESEGGEPAASPPAPPAGPAPGV